MRIAALPLSLVLGSGLGGEDGWPQWRGPRFDGSTDASGLPERFGPEENVLWTAPLPGPGAGTPAVAGGRVFLPAFDDATGKLRALALDAATGELLWSRECGTGKRESERSRGRENSLAACSPVVGDGVVAFLFGTGELFAFTPGGEPLWTRSLLEDYGELTIGWGYAASPLLLDGTLVVPLLRRGTALVVAYEAASGELLWEELRATEARAESMEAYTTPVPFRDGGRTQVLVYGGDALTGHDPATGEELWRWEGANPQRRPNFRAVSSPVVGEGGLVFVTTPQHGPMHGLRVADGEVEVLWRHEAPTSDTPTPLLYRGRLYVLDGRRGRLACLVPATGEVLWQAELETPTFLRASPTGADGKVYLMDAEGTVVVLRAGDEHEELFRVAFDSYPSRSTIVATDGRLYVRTAEQLFCIGTQDLPSSSEGG